MKLTVRPIQALQALVVTLMLARSSFQAEYSYNFYGEAVTREEAAANCTANGMELMKPSSKADIDAIRSALGQHIGRTQVYTALMKSKVPEKSALWQSGQPSGDGECVALNFQGSWLLNDVSCTAKVAYVCQGAPPATTTPSPNNDVIIIGVVGGVVGLLLVASVVMVVYKKRQVEEQRKIEMERVMTEREMEMQMAEMEMVRQVQLEQQRAMEMEGHYSASMESLAREVDSLRMKDIQQQQELREMEKTQETGLVKQISSLVFGGQPTESTAQRQSSSRLSMQRQPSSRLSMQHSSSRMGQDRHARRHSRHSPSGLSVQHPGRGHSPSRLMVDPSQTSYNPHRF